MAFHMIDRNDRLLPDEAKGVGKINADPERGLKSWPIGDGNRVNVRHGKFRNLYTELLQELRFVCKHFAQCDLLSFGKWSLINEVHTGLSKGFLKNRYEVF